MLNYVQLNFFTSSSSMPYPQRQPQRQAIFLGIGFPQTTTQIKLFVLAIAVLLLVMTNKYALAEAHSPEAIKTTVGQTNFSFAHYLGTGFYTSSGQSVFVFQIPFDHTIKQKTDTESGILLNLPLTVGIINFDGLDLENIPEISDLTTFTFLPGIEYQIPITPDWTITPFFDYGFARDFSNKQNIHIIGLGIKSTFYYHFENSMLRLGNRFLYAREQTKESDNDADYSLIETGLNYQMPTRFLSHNGHLHSNFYYINFYYPNNLVFLESTENPIRVGMEHELGITVSNISDLWFFEKPQIGLGIRFSDNVKIIRIIFGAPF